MYQTQDVYFSQNTLQNRNSNVKIFGLPQLSIYTDLHSLSVDFDTYNLLTQVPN